MGENKGYFIGVDVGTQSVRAGLVTTQGAFIKVASLPIKTWNPFPDVYEQSSDNIWNLCVKVIQDVTNGIDPAMVLGIGFDATCSLVALDKDFKPLSVSKTGNPDQNIILWMDHRAIKEADLINKTNHEVLKYVGNKISPEMESPKLLWLKKNLPEQWEKAGCFFDLPDFLTWKATGSLQRSLCSLVCKWTYIAGTTNGGGWQDAFWKSIGLEDLISRNYEKIGSNVLSPGEACGDGLNVASAKETGLIPGTPVSTSIIDAHAGGLGVLACNVSESCTENLEERMALICGTSTCHMKVKKDPVITPGVWGPYYSAMVPGYWCSEAGQSAAGVLLDHVINSHPATNALKQRILKCEEERHIANVLNEMAEKLKEKKGLSSVSLITSDYHVYPDYHGNRSPLANPDIKGMICGLTLASDEEDLVKQYVATVQSLAYSTKHIISALQEKGHIIKCLLVCGGLSKNPLYVQMHADITGLPIIVPNSSEPVLLGCAILAASAAKYYPSVVSAMTVMCGNGILIKPNINDQEYHGKKYKAYLNLLKCQEDIKCIMNLVAS
ncbi:FGGY carbohydrate kinase domain-containing protein [Araneus ventricosus]|uniref:FGGY carbohydrate kinase domain-containing protein n=1 Tax=Araneus ventricosus TaxID=182803 RepID=A0A4Y2L6J9_ARAVE|nr:FGGY carbohydrate kinase domain-containing protein [Araneus ventricosus]